MKIRSWSNRCYCHQLLLPAMAFLLCSYSYADNPSIKDQQSYNAIEDSQELAGVSLLAGSIGGPGNIDGIGKEARFDSPGGVAVDAFGVIYVADTGNNTIRKILPTGKTSTFVGSPGVKGSLDGVGANARFNKPQAVALDAYGNLYVADTGNSTIRKVLPSGVVTTIAGSAMRPGYADGMKKNALFISPVGLAIDENDNIYVADRGNDTIRKIAMDGAVSTLADFSGSVFRNQHIENISLGKGGSLFVTDFTAITEIDRASGKWIKKEAISAEIAGRFPRGMALDKMGNLYLANGDNTIVKIETDGRVVVLAGMPTIAGYSDGNGLDARFNAPTYLAVDPEGNLYVADLNNDEIRKISRNGYVTTLAGSAPEWPYKTEADGLRESARFYFPSSLSADIKNNIYVTDDLANTIRKITPQGLVTTIAGRSGVFGATDGPEALATFNGPAGIALDDAGNIYVADQFNFSVRRINKMGEVETLGPLFPVSKLRLLLKSKGVSEAIRIAARLKRGVTNVRGDTYVIDSSNNTIVKVSPSGVGVKIAGTAGSPGFSDGARDKSRFNMPSGLAADENGNIYVADSENNVIRKISSNGVVSTIVGTPGLSGVKLGSLPGSLYKPKDVVFIRPHTLIIATPEGIVKAVLR